MHVIKRRAKDWKKIVRVHACVRTGVYHVYMISQFVVCDFLVIKMLGSNCQLQYTVHSIIYITYCSSSRSRVRVSYWLSLAGQCSQHNFCRTHVFLALWWFMCNAHFDWILNDYFPLNSNILSLSRANVCLYFVYKIYTAHFARFAPFICLLIPFFLFFATLVVTTCSLRH